MNSVASGIFSITLFSCVSHAVLLDTAISKFNKAMPVLGLTLILVVLIEAFYLSRRLAVSGAVAGKLSVIANIVSAFVGALLAWLSLFALQAVADSTRGYLSGVHINDFVARVSDVITFLPSGAIFDWRLALAGILLLVPFFFISWFVEYRVAKKMLARHADVSAIKVSVRNANLITYSLLVPVPVIWSFVRAVVG